MPWSQPTRHFRVDVHADGDERVTVRLAGDLDLASLPHANRAVRHVAWDAKRILLDMSRVTFFDASGIRFLLAMRMRADAAGGELIVRHPNKAVTRVLELTGLLKLVRQEQPGGCPAGLTRDVTSVLNSAVAMAIRVTGADMANAQLLTPSTGALRIVAQRGFERPFLDFFDTVHDEESACGAALAGARPVWVPEVARSGIFAGTPALDVMLDAGSEAVASVPVRSRDGAVVAMISAHRRRPGPWTHAQKEHLERLARSAGRLLPV